MQNCIKHPISAVKVAKGEAIGPGCLSSVLKYVALLKVQLDSGHFLLGIVHYCL